MAPDLRDEIDFRDILKRPSNLFGFSFVYVLVLLVGLGIYYVQQITTVGQNQIQPVVFEDSSSFLSDIPLQRARELPPVDVMQAGKPSEALLRQGSELYAANCASCHGETGRGDGPAGLQLNPAPRNFHSAQGWTNGPSVAGIYTTLEAGIVRNGMASYNYLPPLDRFALIHFVRDFVPDLPEPSAEELQQLELTYQLSRGRSVPGQIPVRKATEIVLRQNAAALQMIREATAQVIADRSPGARLLRRFARDIDRVVGSFLARPRGVPTEQEFRMMVLSDPLGLGFRAQIARCTQQEWALLHQYLAGVQADAGSPAVRMF